MTTCSFCGKEFEDADLIEGKTGYICTGCLYVGLEMAEGESFLHETLLSEHTSKSSSTHSSKKTAEIKVLKPSELKARLDEYVIGQEDAKRLISTEIYAHLKKQSADHVDQKKHNICLIGPSGSGKTYLVECLARELNIPLVTEDATTLSKTGYVGNSVSTMLERLYYAAKGDLALAQKGIIFIDEIDKLSSRFNSSTSKSDVGTVGVQQELLKTLEGTTVDITISDGRGGRNVSFDTRQILFIVGGAFDGLDEVKKKKVTPTHLGFGLQKTEEVEIFITPTERTTHQDLMDYGLMRELAGRLSLLIDLKPLTEEEIKQVMTDSKGSVIRSYQRRFENEGITLLFADETISLLAQSVSKSKLGVRGIEGQLSFALNQLLYESLQKEVNSEDLTITPELLKSHFC